MPGAASAPRAVSATIIGNPAGTVDVIFDASSTNVTPPTALKRYIPAWPGRAAGNAWRGNYKGALQIVVGETGAVIESSLAEPVHPIYDATLLSAARTWRFTPATENGRPVKYRLLYPIVVSDR